MFTAQVIGSEVANLLRNIEKINITKQNNVKKLVAKYSTKIEKDAKIDAPKNLGYLRNQIGTEIINNGYTGEVHSRAAYSFYVEFGTRQQGPYHQAGKMPPFGYDRAGHETPLMMWVRLKFGLSEKGAKSISYLIARKIKMYGTKPQPFLYPAWKTNKLKFEEELKLI